MELIPILSTIILVATISTFILAVGAYILFKIREGKAQIEPRPEPKNLQAEYIIPKDKQVKKVLLEEIGPGESKETFPEDRYKSFSVIEPEYNQDKTSADQKIKKADIELPKSKFVNVRTLDSPEKQKEFFDGEIKWR